MNATKSAPTESDQERYALLLDAHRLSESRQVEARFYTGKADENPQFVVIDGLSYRLEKRQRYHMLLHQMCDLRAKFLRDYGLACFDAMFAIESLDGDCDEDNQNFLERKMLDMFPAYPKVIGWAIGYVEGLELADLPPGATAEMPQE